PARGAPAGGAQPDQEADRREFLGQRHATREQQSDAQAELSGKPAAAQLEARWRGEAQGSPREPARHARAELLDCPEAVPIRSDRKSLAPVEGPLLAGEPEAGRPGATSPQRRRFEDVEPGAEPTQGEGAGEPGPAAADDRDAGLRVHADVAPRTVIDPGSPAG